MKLCQPVLLPPVSPWLYLRPGWWIDGLEIHKILVFWYRLHVPYFYPGIPADIIIVHYRGKQKSILSSSLFITCLSLPEPSDNKHYTLCHLVKVFVLLWFRFEMFYKSSKFDRIRRLYKEPAILCYDWSL